MSRHASLNRQFALVWNESTGRYVAAPETARQRGRRGGGCTAVAAAVAALFVTAAHAGGPQLPSGGQVVRGDATISQSGATTTIRQRSATTAIDWQDFSIGAGGTVDFLQPSRSAIAVNRVLGNDASRIYGRLNANGQVFLLNPNGVLFAPGAQVQTGGLVASTRTISDEDIARGRWHLAGGGSGQVVNEGLLRAAPGGYVALIGAQVVNQGRIEAPGGDVRLAAADAVTITIDGQRMTGFAVERGTYDALVASRGLIQADGGRVFLTADGADALARAVVNHSGVIEARSVEQHGGVVELRGDAAVGRVEVSGTVDVSSADGRGGQVVATARDVRLGDGAQLDARGAVGGGTVLVGGGWQGQDASVANAKTVVVAPGAAIDVGATRRGDGGTAVLWSDEATVFAGRIGARGGAAGGDGGRVETSSHDSLQAVGVVDAAAPAGAAGRWLLDPRDVTIAASGASGTAYSVNFNPSADSVILASSIVNSLNNGTSVTITTGSTGTSDGNITVSAPIAVSSLYGYTPTLTLRAANDINVNAAISYNAATYGNKLSVVLTPDSDTSGAGSVSFGAGGRITTGGGNVYIGSVSGSGSSEAVAARGQNLTMTAGSSIDVGGGMLDVKVNGAISLSASSLTNTGGIAYYNDGMTQSLRGSLISLQGASITSSNTAAATPDIVSRVATTLAAGTIGDAANPLKISGGSSRGYDTLSVQNSSGDSYVNQVTRQAFGTISVALGSQASSTTDLRILGDAGGDGHSGTGHLLLQTDAGGVLRVAGGDVRTAGAAGNSDDTHVVISATTITFADASVNTGAASFTASATTLRAEASANEVADILAPTVRLNGQTVGTLAAPIELSSGSTTSAGSLYVSNSGGSTFLKSVDDNFTSVTMAHVKDAGTHSLLFAGGDHLDYTTDGSNIVTPTIAGGASDGRSFGATQGLDVSRRARNLTLSATTGGLVFGDLSIDTASGSFTAEVPRGNATATIAALNAYDAMNPVAQITAGNVSFSVLNDLTPSVTSIGAGGKDIQIAQGAGAANNTLAVSTQQGSVAIHELTNHHFKSVNLSLGSASASQAVAIDLLGPDDIQFGDDGTGVTVDASKVAVAEGNRNFSLSAGARNVQIDGNAMGTGDYSVYAGLKLRLNADVQTDGGDINLTGLAGVDLMQSVRIDSNVGRSGDGGSVSLSTQLGSATVSSTGGSRTLTIDSSSTDGRGGAISLPASADSRAGAFLAGLTLNAAGSAPANDGNVALGSLSNGVANTYLLKGGFSATGRTSLSNWYGTTIDTEQGNSAAAGDIVFAGADLSSYAIYGPLSFNASTGLAGANGGNVQLVTQRLGNQPLQAGSISVLATGGAGGTAGDITVPAVTTTKLYGGTGAQAYSGRIVTLDGDLQSGRASVAITGDVRLARSVRIDTDDDGTSASGGVTINGAGVSATATGQSLTIDTGNSGVYSGGGVTIAGGATAAGGALLDSLTINTRRTGGGSHGNIVLGAAVATERAQTYTGGILQIAGGLTTNGGDIDLSGMTSLLLSGTGGSAIVFDTDRAGGTGNAGALRLGTNALNGNFALTIDTTADGGGSAAALTLNGVGSTTAFASIDVAAGTLSLTGTARSSGALTMEARGAAADLTIGSGAAAVTTGASDIVLAAGRNFTNNRSGGLGIVPGSGGRYLVYSTDPAASLEGMTGYQKHYDQTYTAGATPGYAGSGNWFLYSVAPVISVASNGSTVVYGNADPSLVLTSANYSGFIDGDTLAAFGGSQSLSLAAPGTLSNAGLRQVGSYAYTLNGTLTDSLGYHYAAFNESLAVTPRAVAVSGLAASGKVYDGNTSAALTGVAAAVGMAGDLLTVDASGASAAFADRHAGTAKAVSASGFVLGGADAGNYTLDAPTGLAADITPKALTVTGSSVTSKVYDGGTAATVVAGTLSGFVGSETVGASGSGVFADKHAASGKSVSASYVLADGANGGRASDYSLAGETLAGDITPKAITVTGTGVDKVYDGTTAATATFASSGVIGGDVVSFGGTAVLADKNAGSARTVLLSGIGATGADAGNYSFATTGSTTANVARRAITVTATGTDRAYDGTTAVGVTLASTGVLGGDDLGFTGSGAMADKHAGNHKAVAVTGISTTGADAANYSVNTTAATTASITPKAITLSASGVGKVYDGSTAVGVAFASADLLPGDAIVFAATGTMADRHAGLGKSVAISGLGATGADAGDYSWNTPASTTVDVTPKAITVAATAAGKTYDGTTAVSATLASAGVVGGDSVSFAGSAALADKHAGLGRRVDVTGITASGAEAGNYSINTSAVTSADVAQRVVTVAATGIDKVYDGTTAAQVALASGGVLAGDHVAFGGVATLADKNVGTGKAVTVSGITASGADAGDYSFNTGAGATANVTPKPISIVATATGKTYDGTTAISAALAGDGVVGGDVVAFNGSAALADKRAGTARPVLVSGIGASGADAGNYSFAPTTSTTVDVAQRAITVTATGVDKVYDGTTAAAALLAGQGILAGDEVLLGGSATLADKNVGQGKAVQVDGIHAGGADGGNYIVNTSASTTASVTPRSVVVAAQGVDKVYDGTTAATALLSSADLVAGDAVQLAGLARLADRHAGSAKPVAVDGITLQGGDAGNYQLASTQAATTADVTPRPLAIAGQAAGKTYDGSADIAVSASAGGVVAGDDVAVAARGELADRNAGSGRSVLLRDVVLSGADAGNYSVGSVGTASADIAARLLGVTLAGSVSKAADGRLDAPLSPANFVLTGLVGGETVRVTRGSGSFDTVAVGQGKAVSVTLGDADYAAGADTLLSNYALFNGTLTAAIGSIVDNVASTPSYVGAIAAATLPATAVGAVPPLMPDVPPPANAGSEKGVSTVDGDDAGPRQGTARRTEAGQVATNTRENLQMRRTFSVSDGGMRLPAGVRGSQKDANE